MYTGLLSFLLNSKFGSVTRITLRPCISLDQTPLSTQTKRNGDSKERTQESSLTLPSFEGRDSVGDA